MGGVTLTLMRKTRLEYTHLSGGASTTLIIKPAIYLCPTFFDTGRTVQRNAATLIHELTHRVVQARSLQPHVYFGHPRLGTQGVKLNRQVDLALSLARRRAVAARRSPVNYALLCFELGMRRPPVPRDFT